MKAFKWFLIGIVILLLAKLALFYMFPNGQGSLLVQWGGYDYRATAIDAVLILIGVLMTLMLIWSVVTAPVRVVRGRRVVADRQELTLSKAELALERGDYERTLTLLSAADMQPLSAHGRELQSRAQALREAANAPVTPVAPVVAEVPPPPVGS